LFQLFDKLREEGLLNVEKLIPISGDVSEKGLGLSAVDRQMLVERVTIIIHAAASVKFNDSLKYAILTNIRATRDICILAQNMKNLIVRKKTSCIYVTLFYVTFYTKIRILFTNFLKNVIVYYSRLITVKV